MSHRRPRCSRTGWLTPLSRAVSLAALAAASQVTQAQALPAASAPPANDASARAQRDADKVFMWIRMHSDKPRKAAAAAPAPADKPAVSAPAAAVRTAAKPAKTPDPVITETVEPILAPASAARTDMAARSTPSQATVAVAPAHAEPPKPAPVAAAPAVDEDVTLTPVRKPDPEFPGSLMRSLRKGAVQVAFTVQPDGSVAQAHVVSASHPRLGAPAVETVTQWRFKPVPHAQQAVVDLGFNLD